MRTVFNMLLLSLLTSGSAVGSNWYVEPASQGLADGTSWCNAWSLSSVTWSNINPGDTVWIAGGTYTDSSGITVRASGSASSPILIYRATAQDAAATSSPGWDASLDSQAVIEGGIHFPGPLSYVTVSGRTPSGFYWFSGADGGYGSTAGMGPAAGNVSNVTLQYYEMNGSANTTGRNGPTYGINWAPTGGQYTIGPNCVVEHCYIHSMSETVRANGWNGVTVQYCKIGDTNNLGDHADLAYMYYSQNVIWRYNTFYNSPGDGMYHEHGVKNYWIFGNVFYNCNGDLISVGNVDGGNDGPYYICNNFFGGVVGGNSAVAFSHTINPASQCYNNIFWNCSNWTSNGAGFTQSAYNAYNYTSYNGYAWPSNESNSFTFRNNPFMDVAAGNVQFASRDLAAPFAHGMALASEAHVNYDSLGNKRGNPWYIGTYQYVLPNLTNPTVAPSRNLHITESERH